jgi:hypothetical protein
VDKEEAPLAEVIRGDFPIVEEHGGAPRPPLSIAALNLSPGPGRVEDNLRLAGRTIRRLCGRDPSVRWVVLPELFTCGYSDLGSVHRHAEDAGSGESARFFAGLARELGIFVAYGFPERGPHTDVFDSANLVGPGGVIATYRKRNLVETTLEYRVFAAGADLPVVETGGLRVTLAICWDLGFPEVAREAAAGGAELLLAPAAWREPWGGPVRPLLRRPRPGLRHTPGQRQPAGRLPRGPLRCPRPRLRSRRREDLPAVRRRERRPPEPRCPRTMAGVLRGHPHRARPGSRHRRRVARDRLLTI